MEKEHYYLQGDYVIKRIFFMKKMRQNVRGLKALGKYVSSKMKNM